MAETEGTNRNQGYDALFEQLISINHETFQAGCYETAYHALAAAFHCAQDIGDIFLITRIQEIATQQMKEIDSCSPDHPLSSRSAQTCKHQSIYGLLAQQAATRIRILSAQAHLCFDQSSSYQPRRLEAMNW